MIRVVFKLNKSNEYGSDEFTYANYDKAQVNDIVVVNTRYGYAIAKVTAIDIEDSRFTEDKLANVKMVIESAEEQKEKVEKINAYNTLVKKIRRCRIESELSKFCTSESEQRMITLMTEEELDLFYKALIK